jgi:hypothetical protein
VSPKLAICGLSSCRTRSVFLHFLRYRPDVPLTSAVSSRSAVFRPMQPRPQRSIP